MSKIVVALGGHIFGDTPTKQRQLVKQASSSIVDLIEQGHDVIVSHGNSPQVGMIQQAFRLGEKQQKSIPFMPLSDSGAMSQGYIGNHLQNALREELKEREINKSVVVIVTQTIVDKQDKEFRFPTKPIGIFYTKKEADKRMRQNGEKYVEDSGRGYRKVIPSPIPIRIVEQDSIDLLVKAGMVVVAVGGGGIPVVEEGNRLSVVEAVIDKDFSSQHLAQEMDADYLFILTEVDKVALNFAKANQKNLEKMSVSETEKWMKEGHFLEGSMLPKVQAAILFVKSKRGRKAIITSMGKTKEAILGLNGTIIYEDSEG
ncbi:carbamate kinase [Carnobacterium sp.]|uniref:carbamate kinase n=1 Tax=Carnobacterium sp. TaxID=48221 RepID=UPI003C7419B3